MNENENQDSKPRHYPVDVTKTIVSSCIFCGKIDDGNCVCDNGFVSRTYAEYVRLQISKKVNAYPYGLDTDSIIQIVPVLRIIGVIVYPDPLDRAMPDAVAQNQYDYISETDRHNAAGLVIS